MYSLHVCREPLDRWWSSPDAQNHLSWSVSIIDQHSWLFIPDASSSIKVSIAVPKFASSTLMTATLKVVTIECIEHDVTCLNERVYMVHSFYKFIKTMNHLLTNCSQSTLLAMICRLSLLVLNTS